MLAATTFAELPSGGYNYAPQGGFGGGVSGGSFGGSGGGYQQVPIGGQTYEGQQVDAELLEKIRQILLQEESKAGAGGHSGGHSGGGISSQYGAPQPQYGPPAAGGSRVVGIELGQILQAMQVAQYLKQETQAVSGGYSRGPAGGVASSYSAPSQSYGAPSRPSSSYGAPF